MEFIATGNRTFIDARLKGQGKGSNAPFDGHLYQVITSREPGETIHPRGQLLRPQPGLEAAGLSE